MKGLLNRIAAKRFAKLATALGKTRALALVSLQDGSGFVLLLFAGVACRKTI